MEFLILRLLTGTATNSTASVSHKWRRGQLQHGRPTVRLKWLLLGQSVQIIGLRGWADVLPVVHLLVSQWRLP